MSHLSTTLPAALFATGALLAALGPASTAAPNGVASAHDSFAEEGRDAGLSPAQVGWLQSTVEHEITRSGGRQTALNVVHREGAELRIALPGEKRPRRLGALAAGPCDGGTAPGWFCAYSDTYGNGSQLAMYTCNTYSLPGWTSVGSWGDSQTPGTRTLFETKDHTVWDEIYAPNNVQEYDWVHVWFIKNC
ncbi:hypothetical protein [Luteipulveratus mongoliensis]|uniref:hypothetical protein n=1 Tax=Luteipulveratus mongoliensis TaxID=571913 RepID=UPI0006966844|nr:hypothetical protein [Luteipulveratus mongoliensis]